MNILWAYLTYTTVSVGLTIWVATSLHRHGHVFLMDASHGREELAASLGHLLKVGFHLMALGFILVFLPMQAAPQSPAEIVEALSTKEGKVLLMLGVMHFFQLWVLSRARRRAMDDTAPPPVAPDGKLSVA